MKISSLVFASMLLLKNTIAQNDGNTAVRIETPAKLPPLQTPAVPSPSSSYFESVWVKVLAGINTECKTCPNSLCSNKNFYGGLMMFRATCWTNGEKINATSMWLHSEDDCFVTAQDTLKYWRNYNQDLKPCQNVPKPNATPRRTSARAASDCKRCPNDKCETMKSYERRDEVSITCRAQGLPDCLEDCLPSDIPPANKTTVFPWLKTTANCYVKSSSLAQARSKRQTRPYEDCGPVPYLDFSYRVPPPPAPPMTATVTSTQTVYYPVTTTVIIHKNPCDSPNCPPLIWAFTPPAATASPLVISPNSTGDMTLTPTSTGGTSLNTTSIPSNTTIPNTPITGLTVSTKLTLAPSTFAKAQPSDPPPSSTFTISFPSSSAATNTSATSPGVTIVPTSLPNTTPIPTTNPGITLTPTTTPGITLTPTTNPGITLTPTNNPDITLTPTNNPGITLTPTKNPEITLPSTPDPGTALTPVLGDPITFTQTLTLPPITIRSVMTNVTQAYANQNSTRLPKCNCEPAKCEGGEGSNAQAMCTALAAEKCAKTCPSAPKATQASLDPFQPLMLEGGRPPPNQAPSQEKTPSSADDDYAPDHAPSVRVQVDGDCKCAPMKCPEAGDEADACRLVYMASCSLECGRGTPASKVEYGGATVLVITQLIAPSAVAVVQ